MFFRGPLAELVAMVDLKLYHKNFTYDSKGVELLNKKTFKKSTQRLVHFEI